MLSGFRVHSSLKSEALALIDFMSGSVKKLMVEPSATVGLGLNSADAVVSAGQTSGLDIHIVSSTSASVLLGKAVDARSLYPDACDL